MAGQMFGFSDEQSIRNVARATGIVLKTHNEMPAARRWRPTDSGSGPSCTRVRFSILVADAASRSALCHIMARPYQCGVGDVPDTLFDGLVIEVCDPAGCFLNETDDDLAGRVGWAEYVLPISGASHCQPGNTNYYLVPEWEVYSLCCKTFACEL